MSVGDWNTCCQLRRSSGTVKEFIVKIAKATCDNTLNLKQTCYLEKKCSMLKDDKYERIKQLTLYRKSYKNNINKINTPASRAATFSG